MKPNNSNHKDPIIEYLFNLSKENIMNKKRRDKLENDIRILHYKKYN